MALPTLVIMAAGIGSRYGGLKQIDPIGPSGEIVIDYSIYDAIKANFGKVVFIIRRDIEKLFREKIGNTIEKQIDTAYVYQDLDSLPLGFSVPDNRQKPWGTAHAVLVCKNIVNEPFVVINADDFYGASSFNILSSYLRTLENIDNSCDFALAGYILKNTLSDNGHVARGVCSVTDDEYLSKIDERIKIKWFDDIVRYEENDGTWTEVSANSIVSMNMWGFTTKLFDAIEDNFPIFLKNNIANLKSEFLLPEVVGDLVNEKQATVKILKSDEKWYGVTYQEDKPVVQQAIKNMVSSGIYPEKLWG